MDKGVRLLKKNFLTSRSMYLVGLNGHNIQLQRAMKRNWHLADEIRNDAEIMDTVHEKWLPKIYGEIRGPRELDENDFDQVELEYEEIVNLRDTFTHLIRDSVLTKEKVELLRDYGPEKLLIVAGQYDFARDSDVITARRLKAYGVQTDLVVVEKAYHATLVKYLGESDGWVACVICGR
jgi:acetyl esterase/lipase